MSERPTRRPGGHLSGSVLGIVVDGCAITGLAAAYEDVWCECADPDCRCMGSCRGKAFYAWGSMDEDHLEYLCHRCGLRLVERGGAYAPAETPPSREEDDGAG